MIFKRIGSPRRRAVVVLITSLMFFSISQYFNWLIGFDLQWFSLLVGTIGTIYLLTCTNHSWAALLIAAVLAATATYSLANGLTLWWIALGSMLLDRRAWGLPKLIAWAIIGATVCIFFFIGWKPLWQADPHFWLRHPKLFLEYVLSFLGNCFGDDSPHVSILFGALGIALLAYNVRVLLILLRTDRSTLWPAAAPWLMLIVTSLVSAVICAIARCPLGIVQSLSSRYVSEANLFWIGLVGLVFWIDSMPRKRRLQARLTRVRAAYVTLGLLFTGAYILEQAQAYHNLQDQTELADTAFVIENDMAEAPDQVKVAVLPEVRALNIYVGMAHKVNDGPFDSPPDSGAAQVYLRSVRLMSIGQYSAALPGLLASSRTFNFAFVHYKISICDYRTRQNGDAEVEYRRACALDWRYKHLPYAQWHPDHTIWAYPGSVFDQ